MEQQHAQACEIGRRTDGELTRIERDLRLLARHHVFGIALAGAVNTQVRHNRIEGQTAGGLPDGFAAGIAVFDFGTVASGNVVAQNFLRNNDFDLSLGSGGTGNVFTHNKCTSSYPPEPELCLN